MLRFIQRLFAWWNGATLGTSWTLFTSARFVGRDDFGNRYYEERRRRGSFEGRKRRWVTYNGYADASRIPSDWHGWMHHTFDEVPNKTPLPRQAWERDHRPNLTGTLHACRPRGALARGGERRSATGDYEAWAPDEG